MRENGTLIGLQEQEIELNEFGEPVAGSTIESNPIPCSITPNNDNRKGVYEDGEFRQASYTILIEMQDFPFARISMKRGDEQLGEFRVLEAQPLETVGRVQILV